MGGLFGLAGAAAILATGGTIITAVLTYIIVGAAGAIVLGLSGINLRKSRRNSVVLPPEKAIPCVDEALQERLFSGMDERRAMRRETTRRAGLVIARGLAETQRLRFWLWEIGRDAMVCHDPLHALSLIREHPDFFEYIVIDAGSLGESMVILLCDFLEARTPDIRILVLRKSSYGRISTVTERKPRRGISAQEVPTGKTAFKMAVLGIALRRSEVLPAKEEFSTTA